MGEVNGSERRRRHSAPAVQWKKLRQRQVETKIRLVRGKYLCLVTGAGNGLGRALAGLAFQDQGIFPLAMSGSKVILVDSDEEGLKETSGKKMRQFLKHRKIDVELITVDLSDLNEVQAMMEKIGNTYEKDYERAIFINNAYTIGDVSKELSSYNDAFAIQRFWDLNITSRMYLATEFCKLFEHSKRTVVNTFRFDVVRSTPYLGLSYMAQNAIDAFGESFAKENPTINILHYTPHIIDTRKTKTILDTCGNKELQQKLESLYEHNKLQQPLEAAKKVTKILEDDEFISGQVIKYEDDVNNIIA